MASELRRRGLRTRTIEAAELRMAGPSELPRDHRTARGLRIPYWTVRGERSGFYRVRFFPPILLSTGGYLNGHANGTNGTNGTNGHGLVGASGVGLSGLSGLDSQLPSKAVVPKPKGPKVMRYWQPAGTDPHIYLPPPGLVDVRVWSDPRRALIVTEGEFKALCAVQAGFPAVAVGGINAWMRRVTQKPDPNKSAATSAAASDASKPAKSGRKSSRDATGKRVVAEELRQIVWQGRLVYLVFDTEPSSKPATRVAVQRAQFELGLWLEQQGAEVRQVVLPELVRGEKTGLDDFLASEGAYALTALLADKRAHKFPQRPELIPWLVEQMDRPRLRTSEMIAVCQAVLADLDSRGQRYHDTGLATAGVGQSLRPTYNLCLA
jgi:hypothetical protein